MTGAAEAPGGRSAAPLLSVEGLTVRYPDFELRPLSVRFDRGERVALVGENGAGKSTVMRAIAGLHRDYEGRVEVEGAETRALGAAVRTRVGLLPERLLGFGWMTVAEHLRFLAGFHPTWDAAHADALRARLALPERTRLAHLSKGMAVKLSLVAAEAFRPPILLLDEPTSGIDPVMRREILDLVDEVASTASGRVVVFSTHILEDVEAVAERVILLRRGRLVADATVDALVKEAGGASLSRAIYTRLTTHG